MNSFWHDICKAISATTVDFMHIKKTRCLPLILMIAISSPAAPGSVGGTGTLPSVPADGINAQRNAVGNAPDNNNNAGYGEHTNDDGAFNQPASPLQPGSPAVTVQTTVSNNIVGQTIYGQGIYRQNVSGQNIVSQDTNQMNVFGVRQQYNQQGWMTNRPPILTNTPRLQPWLSNAPPLLTNNGSVFFP
jgi:hypothetical protein